MIRFIALTVALLLPAAAHAHGPGGFVEGLAAGFAAGVALTVAVGVAVVLLRRRYMPARM